MRCVACSACNHEPDIEKLFDQLVCSGSQCWPGVKHAASNWHDLACLGWLDQFVAPNAS